MLGQAELKRLFHEVIQNNPAYKDIKQLDTLIVKVYHYLMDEYGEQYNKDDATEIALCIWHRIM